MGNTLCCSNSEDLNNPTPKDKTVVAKDKAEGSTEAAKDNAATDGAKGAEDKTGEAAADKGTEEPAAK